VLALFAALVLAFLALLVLVAPVSAQGAVTITSGPEVEPIDLTDNDFPQRLRFNVSLQSDQVIEDVTLRYRISDGSSSFKRAEITPGNSVTADVTVDVNAGQNYLPVGTVFSYWFEVTTADGVETETEPVEYTFLDPRFEWSELGDDNLTVYYHSGDAGSVESVLATSRESLAEMSALLGTTIDFPVKIVFYESAGDMADALQGKSESFDQQVVTCGVRVARDLVLLNEVECGGGGHLDILRHELTHVVTKQAGEGGFGALPFWLDEGTAVYSQSSPGEGFQGAFERSLQRDTLVPIAQLTRQPTQANEVNLFYGQSWALVNYLVETYGQEKFAELYATFKEGNTTDGALTAVYGFDQAGLENEFRESLGLEPRQAPTEEPEDPAEGNAPPPANEQDEQNEPDEQDEPDQQAEPTDEPDQEDDASGAADEDGDNEGGTTITTQSSSDSDDPPVFLISMIVAVMLFLLAGLVWLFTVFNKPKSPPPPPPPAPPSTWAPPASE
jgi:hypothetical protein